MKINGKELKRIRKERQRENWESALSPTDIAKEIWGGYSSYMNLESGIKNVSKDRMKLIKGILKLTEEEQKIIIIS